MTLYQYVTSDETATTHLRISMAPGQDRRRTICGRSMDGIWHSGDETTSGVSASCGACVRIAGANR